jgi:ribulose-5-phosphate 4-epimerase/fuculose-1-phosphate aldolase
MAVSIPDTRKDSIPAGEWQLRVELAACYRLVALFGWDDLVFTHISARIPGPYKHFLINPYGFLFEEITASSLLKIDTAGRLVDPSPYPVNPAGFTIHSAIHEAREDAHCVLHLHTTAGVAVAAQSAGLLPISQQSLLPLASLAYHDYEGIVLNPDEKVRLVADLGQSNFMILRNHGLLTCGTSVAAAFVSMYILQRACEVQFTAQAGGGPLITIAQSIRQNIMADTNAVTRGSGAELLWPALLRKLDRVSPGYKN